MARLITYPIDQNVTGTDKLIGTNSGGDETKNYTLNGISNWVDETGAVTIVGQNNFKLQTTNVTGRKVRTISLPTYGGVGEPLAGITTLVISQQDASGNTINEYLESLVGSRIMLGQLDDTSNFCIYFINALTLRVGEPGFYDASLTAITSNGSLALDKSYGIAHHPTGEGLISWGDIVGTVTDQIDLVEYIDAEIAAIPQGDITSVVAGTGMTGGGTSGDVTLNVIGGTGITANADNITIDATVATLDGTQTFTNKSGSNDQWTNDAGYTTNTGTVTSIDISSTGSAVAPNGGPITSGGTIDLVFQGDGSEYINGVGDLVTFPVDLASYFDEFTRTNGILTLIETYEDNTKATKLVTKTFSYTTGLLTQLTTLDVLTSVTSTKTFVYDVNGNLINITKS